MVKVRPKRGGNGWEVDVRFRWPDGTVYRERRNAPVSGKDAAKRWAEARERSLLSGGKAALEAPAEDGLTFSAFWPTVVKDHYRANRKKPSTIDAAETIERVHLRPVVGAKRLSEICNADVAKIKGALADARPKTVNNVLTVLSRALRCAVEWEKLPAMPCKIRLLPVSEPAMVWYEVEDYRRLVEAARFSRRVLLLVLLAGSAGLRRGEIIALRWTDIDLKRKRLRIDSSIWRRQEGTTKGGRHRIVPMTDELAAALTAHKHIGERVLYDDKGGELSNRTIRNWLRQAQRRAGLPLTGAAKREKDRGGAIHMLRHTFCSHLAAAGVPAKAIQELAGHADLKTTLRYMHLSPGDRDAAMATLGAYHRTAEKALKAAV
jgi:integrase